jgi:hypothetical protein
MLKYLLNNKKLPENIPQALIEQSREGRRDYRFVLSLSLTKECGENNNVNGT